jgi:hypothetical protein
MGNEKERKKNQTITAEKTKLLLLCATNEAGFALKVRWGVAGMIKSREQMTVYTS